MRAIQLRLFLSVCTVSLLFGCSSPPVKQPAEWGFEKDAIRLHLVGDPQLNLYQKHPHSLLLCLYHLRDPNGWQQLIDEQGGLARLLDCSRFDPSVTYSKRFVVQPGQEVTELVDRADGAKFLGIVAGYYDLQKQRSLRFYPIRITEFEKDSMLVQKPAKLDVDLYLGPHEIKELLDIPKDTPTVKGKEKQ
jgi:type VI secretion system VasD/TssJ family lipoprotein